MEIGPKHDPQLVADFLTKWTPEKQNAEDLLSNALTKAKEQGKRVIQNINNYFNSVDSEGPFLVEQENGPDAYIDDLRQDIFERFNMLPS